MRVMMLGVALLAAGALGACTDNQARRATEGGLVGGTIGLIAGAAHGHPGRSAVDGALIGAAAGATLGTLEDIRRRDRDIGDDQDGGYNRDGGYYRDRSDRGRHDRAHERDRYYRDYRDDGYRRAPYRGEIYVEGSRYGGDRHGTRYYVSQEYRYRY